MRTSVPEHDRLEVLVRSRRAKSLLREDRSPGEFEQMRLAVDALSEKILRLQGDGDYDGASRFVEEMGSIGEQLQADLDRLEAADIPVDVVFEQGL